MVSIKLPNLNLITVLIGSALEFGLFETVSTSVERILLLLFIPLISGWLFDVLNSSMQMSLLLLSRKQIN